MGLKVQFVLTFVLSSNIYYLLFVTTGEIRFNCSPLLGDAGNWILQRKHRCLCILLSLVYQPLDFFFLFFFNVGIKSQKLDSRGVIHTLSASVFLIWGPNPQSSLRAMNQSFFLRRYLPLHSIDFANKFQANHPSDITKLGFYKQQSWRGI